VPRSGLGAWRQVQLCVRARVRVHFVRASTVHVDVWMRARMSVAGFVRLMWEVLPVAHARKERPRLASSFTTRFTTDGLPQIHRGFAVSLCNVRRLLALPDDLVGATLAVRAAGEPKVLCFSKASNAARSSLVGSYSSKSIVGVDSRHAMIQTFVFSRPAFSAPRALVACAE
jgi:hypothetical protein